MNEKKNSDSISTTIPANYDSACNVPLTQDLAKFYLKKNHRLTTKSSYIIITNRLQKKSMIIEIEREICLKEMENKRITNKII